MKKFWLSEKMLANAFWNALECSAMIGDAKSDAKLVASKTSPLVKKFPSIAGSISLDSSFYLWLVTKYFSPSNICEIGTYIGRSTLIMALASADSLKLLSTCDGTFDCLDLTSFKKISSSDQKNKSVEKIRYFGKTMSTDMLKNLREDKINIDFVFIDGRISNNDCEILREITTKDAIFLIDDFEGVEKGVMNAMMLRTFFPNHLLLEPPIIGGRRDRLNLAVLVPSTIINVSRQQSLPVEM